MERVAAVGELGASIAHELNQPLSAILTNAETARRLLQRTPVDLTLLREMIDDIIADDKRAGEIIRRTRALLKKDQGLFVSHDFNVLVRRWRSWPAMMRSFGAPPSRCNWRTPRCP
ncbi:histidine kinase dimerization/phospho-acceptor domain-containing protein [Cystobacter fuscus]